MFKRQTKDKQRIDELEKKNHEQYMETCKLQQNILSLLDKIEELQKENNRLKGVIKYYENPMPYELSVLYQRQKQEFERTNFNRYIQMKQQYGI